MTANRIIVYTTPFCGYCSSAKRLLARKGAEFTEIDVLSNAGHRRDMMERAGGRRTVPQIFIDDRHIGGFDELTALDASGELDRLLAQPATPPQS
jgi:glutaredoxin 3